MNPRVLFFSHSDNLRGGAARSLLELLQHSAKNNLTPIVALPKKGDFSSECQKLGIPCHVVPSVWWVAVGSIDAWLYGMRRLPDAVDTVREIISREKIDVVHSNASLNPVGALAAALESRPHVWHVREFLSKEGVSLNAEPLGFDLLRNLVRSLSYRIIAVSEALACDFREGCEDQKVVTIHDGIDLSQFRDYHFKENRRILAIGASTPDKGLDELVQAAALLKEEGVEAEFRVLGNVEPDGYFEEITRKLEGLGLSETFHLEGYQPDIGSYLANANVFCLPSRSEGMSRVVLEAMASGLPVIATDSGGPSELFLNGKSGLLCQPRNPKALATTIAKVLNSGKLATSLATAGRLQANDNFSVENSTSKVLQLLIESANRTEIFDERPLVSLLLRFIKETGPRTLLGKKWKILKPLL